MLLAGIKEGLSVHVVIRIVNDLSEALRTHGLAKGSFAALCFVLSPAHELVQARLC